MRNFLDELAEMLMEAMEEREREATKEHTHCCGFTLDSGQTVSGCGHKWTHRKSDFKSQEELDAGHQCPKCGAGPWRWQLCDSTLREYDRRRHERAA
jgi:hypothetical protein